MRSLNIGRIIAALPGIEVQEGMEEISGALFDVVRSGAVKIEVNQTYRLSDAIQAHKDLEARKTTGSTVLLT